jgi:membrane-associated protease RseP (regulator of RpoE activity)
VDQPHDPNHPDAIRPAGTASPAAPPLADGPAPPPAPPLTPLGWLTSNGPYLIILLGLTVWAYRHVGFDGLFKWAMVIVGLGFIIFIHELGHFLAAKWCDVHVQTFSIGFGPALPGCSFQRGETTYKIAVIPLGGYVNMVGEGPEADEDEHYPRSFKNKTVGQRMLIISAGVIMNVLLGCLLFVFVYRVHGVERARAVIWATEPGSPAWKAGIRGDWQLESINNQEKQWFENMKVTVALSNPNKDMDFLFKKPDGDKVPVTIRPRRDRETELFPVIGVLPASGLKLAPPRDKKYHDLPVAYRSPAAFARAIDLRPGDLVVAASDPGQKGKVTPLPAGPESWAALCRRMTKMYGEPITLQVRRAEANEDTTVEVAPVGFDFGDTIVGTTDPATPDQPFNVKSLAPDPFDGTGKARDPFAFRRALQELAGRPMVVQVHRYGPDNKETANVLVPPAFQLRWGMRMKIGQIAAIRDDNPREKSPAKQAGVEKGDVLTRVKFSPEQPGKGTKEYRWEKFDPKQFRKIAGRVARREAEVVFEKFDPVRLPFDLAQLAKRLGPDLKDWSVTLTVVGKRGEERTPEPRDLKKVKWQASWDGEEEDPFNLLAPMSIPQLGLAYLVENEVEWVEPGSPAEQARVEKGDRVEEIRFRKAEKTRDAPRQWSDWIELKVTRDGKEAWDVWAHVFWRLQLSDYPEVQFKVRRDEKVLQLPDSEDAALTAKPDGTWPIAERGLLLRLDTRMKKANNLLEALTFGIEDTGDFIKQIYMTLSSLAQGNSSVKSLGGPLLIFDRAFKVADDPFDFAMFMAIISINLAVVNFLPIPVLDGGHMVFLIYEKLRGKPPSETVRTVATLMGLALIVLLMLFVFYQDIGRLWPNWLKLRLPW